MITSSAMFAGDSGEVFIVKCDGQFTPDRVLYLIG